MTSIHLVTSGERPANLIRIAVPRLNKQEHISRYLPQIEARDYDLEWAEVTDTKTLTCSEWNELMGNLLADRDWLAGRGGTRSWTERPNETREIFQLSDAEHEEWKRGAYLLVVAVVAPTGTTVYIDPQGYDYARYVAFDGVGLPEGMTRQERQQKAVIDAKAEKLERIAHALANPPVIPAAHGLKFYYNGIKDNGGKLQKCWFNIGNLYDYPEDTLSISARDYSSFSEGVRACFAIDNHSDSQSDYFDNDHIRVLRTHPLYGEVLAAYNACQSRHAARRVS